MEYKRRLAFVLAFALLTSGWTAAQDAVVVDPKHHKVEFETDQVRVLRITFPPGEQSIMHSHPCAVAIGLTDSTLIFHLPDATTREANLKKGQVINAKPTVHLPENKTGSQAEVILVEVKSGGC